MAMQRFQRSSIIQGDLLMGEARKNRRICQWLITAAGLLLLFVLCVPKIARAQHDGQALHHGGSGEPEQAPRFECNTAREKFCLARTRTSFVAFSSDPSAARGMAPLAPKRRRIAGYVLAGIGLAGIGVGGFLVHKGHSKLDEAPETDPANILDLEEQALRQRRFGFAMIGFGGAATLTSALLLLFAPRSMNREVGSRLLPLATTSSGGLLLRGTF